MSFPRYPEYKNSVIEFFKNIPSSWIVTRLSTVCNFEAGKAHEPYIDDLGKYVCVNSRFISTKGKAVKLCSQNLTPAEPNDTLIVMSDLPNGRALARAFYVDKDRNYAVNQRVCRISSKCINPRFVFYFLDRSPQLLSYDDGLNQTHLPNVAFKNHVVLVPSYAEQITIANFLDHETAKIDTLIAEQKKLIEILKEKRQAMISHAVTKGLDPNVKMKDSGVEWLGEVPEHWQVFRLRNLIRLNPSKSEIGYLPKDTECSFLPMEAIGDDGSLRLELKRPISEVESGYTYFKNGDLTIAKITPCFENGKGALISGLHNGFGFGTTELIVVRPDDEKISSKFLYRLFLTSPFKKLGEGSMYGAGGQKRVPDDFVREFRTAIPSVREQLSIANFLDYEIAKFDTLMAEQTKAVCLLQERRSALISAAVTGQIDVRDFA